MVLALLQTFVGPLPPRALAHVGQQDGVQDYSHVEAGQEPITGQL